MCWEKGHGNAGAIQAGRVKAMTMVKRLTIFTI